MNAIRAIFPSRSIIFSFLAAICVMTGMQPGARAQDRLITATGVQEGRIIGVRAANVMIELPGGRGTIGVPMATVKRVEKDAPPEYAAALRHYQARAYDAAYASLKKLVDQFGGLQTEWALGASSLLGDVLVAQGKYVEAEKAYELFKSRYPGAVGSDRAEVGMARIEVEQKKFEEARRRLEPIVQRALQAIAPDASSSALYGQAFLLMGRIEESAGNLSSALENYLRTVTLFPDDAAAREEAERRAKEFKADITVP